MSTAVTERVFKLLQITRISLHGPVQLPHKLRVTRVYKAILKNQLDWAIFRDVWTHEAAKTQKIFRERAGEIDKVRAEAYVQEAEEYLRSRRHPDPCTPIYLPGGTLYQRNSPLPDYLLKDEAQVNYNEYVRLEAISDTMVNWGERSLASLPWRTSPPPSY